MRKVLGFTACVAVAAGLHVGGIWLFGGWRSDEVAAAPELEPEVAEAPEPEIRAMDDELAALLEVWDEEPEDSGEPEEVASLDEVDQERPDAAEDLFAAPESGPPPEEVENDSEADALPDTVWSKAMSAPARSTALIAFAWSPSATSPEAL
ncbi:MAG: hypothetical protein AAFZ09_09685, partial [Pseudomonadota bacterium]